MPILVQHALYPIVLIISFVIIVLLVAAIIHVRFGISLFTVRSVIILVTVSVLITTTTTLIRKVHNNWLGEQKTKAVLSGSTNGYLDRIVIYYQMRRVICTDPETLRYFEHCLRTNDNNNMTLGIEYKMNIRYQGGGCCALITYWYSNGFTISIDPRGEGNPTHNIRFLNDIPPNVIKITSFLMAPWKEVKGKVLIVERDGIYYQYDNSLIVE